MTLRALVLPAVAAGAFVIAGSAWAEEWIVSPQLTESSRTAPQVGLAADGVLEDSPFYSEFTYRGLTIDEFPEPDWFMEGGADSAYDVDPRKNEYLPRPVPNLVFDLR